MNEKLISEILEEIKREQHPIEDDEILKGYIKDAEYDINYRAGKKIDYTTDLDAKRLLKNYVLYARFARLSEFKQLYGGDYADLQAKYAATIIQWW